MDLPFTRRHAALLVALAAIGGLVAVLLAGSAHAAQVLTLRVQFTDASPTSAVHRGVAVPVTVTASLRNSGSGTPYGGDSVVVTLSSTAGTLGQLPSGCVAAGASRATCDLGALSGSASSIDLTLTADGTSAPVTLTATTPEADGVTVARDVALDPDDPAYDPAPGTRYRLLSAPDFLNNDVADLRKSRWARWHRGLPNSWNGSYAQAFRTVFASWQAFHPDGVSVPGDLVDGHWGLDLDRTGVFGPVDTHRQRAKAIVRASNTYYSAWRARWAAAGLTVYPGIGDHEYGDNPWSGGPKLAEKRGFHGLFARQFSRWFTRKPDGSWRYPNHPSGPARGTAYALRPSRDLALVNLDVFRVKDRDTTQQLDPQQLAWVERTLARAKRDGVKWIVVTGHTPIVGPVRAAPSSSHLMYQRGADSALWRLFKRYGVDIYLCGEVHASTAVVRDGIVQVSHGGPFGFGGPEPATSGGTSFMVSDFGADTVTMKLFGYHRAHDYSDRLWQTASQRPSIHPFFYSVPERIGSITIDSNVADPAAPGGRAVSGRTGLLAHWDGPVRH